MTKTQSKNEENRCQLMNKSTEQVTPDTVCCLLDQETTISKLIKDLKVPSRVLRQIANQTDDTGRQLPPVTIKKFMTPVG